MRQQSSQSYTMEVMSEHLRGSTARSLDLLRHIDGTIDALVMTRKEMDAQREAFEGILPKLSGVPGKLCEKETIPAFEAAQDSLRRLVRNLRPRLDAARRAPELRADDGVVEAYEEVIEAALALNSKIEEAKWAVLEHNADLETDTKPLIMSDPAEIDRYLDSL